ncbi:hypothetical protein TIFTF001_024670 [Ficus carica]|uniref:Uncharacterized protein n=1 Tax=Ficus carica TaxID=3494 RepID=A0AA88AQ73_FICCA|nr:hypothetical protein TIFTF001_024670 [Ficus carica]
MGFLAVQLNTLEFNDINGNHLQCRLFVDWRLGIYGILRPASFVVEREWGLLTQRGVLEERGWCGGCGGRREEE